MLDNLRNAANTWVVKLLLGLLVLSFAVWGISGQVMTGPGGGTVITAGKTTVSGLDFRLAYDQRIASLSRQFGSNLTREQAQTLGLQDLVLSELTTGALLDETARKLSLGVSQEKIAELAASDPTFQGLDGNFDVRRFDYILSQVGMSREQYLQNRSQVARRQQIVDAISTNVKAPNTLLENIALYRGEDRTIEYIVLPKNLVEPVPEPDADALKEFFEDNIEAYASPEYRKISYVKLEAEDIADPEGVDAEELKRYYDQNIERFSVPEHRTIQQINFSNQEDAKAARESLRSGATFEGLVELQGKKIEDVSLGSLTRNQIADEVIANAAFSLEENHVSEIINGTFGPVLLRVTNIEPEKITPLNEVSDELRQQIALADATRLIQDTYDSYEDARAGGSTLTEAAHSLGLNVVTIDAVTLDGLDKDGNAIANIPNATQLLRAAYETEEGIENTPLHIGTTGYLFYEVEDVTPAHLRELADVKDEVLNDWKTSQVTHLLAERSSEYIAAIKQGSKTLDQIASDLGLEKAVKRGLKRGANDPDIGQSGVAAVFNIAKGAVSSVPNPAGDGEFLFHVTEVFQPASVSADTLQENVVNTVNQSMVDDMLAQFATQLQSEISVKVNRSAMQQSLLF